MRCVRSCGRKAPRGVDKQRQNSGHRNLEAHKFPPGVSGNPNGRPKKETPSETLRAMLDEEYGPAAVTVL